MDDQESRIGVVDGAGGNGAGDRRGIVDMVRQLADDTRTLIRQEVDLVKMEVGLTVKGYAADGAWMATGAFIVALGLLVLVLAIALGLGELLGSYWLGTLITGGAFVLIGAVVVWRGVRRMSRRDPLPSGILDSVRRDAEWARSEFEAFGNDGEDGE